MFIDLQSKEQIMQYKQLLAATGALSRLFSASNSPYLHYRLHEQIFCKSFDAQDRSRSDMSVDATKNLVGVGLKTFLHGTGTTFQKIAEFNADRYLYQSLSDETAVSQISTLRNERLRSTAAVYGLDRLVYHCITRSANKMLIFEHPMEMINIARISHIRNSKSSISFSDGRFEYSFNLSKSTLFMKFCAPSNPTEVPVRIINDPFTSILSLSGISALPPTAPAHKQVILPLYSLGKSTRTVHEKSGLNLWNAGGRGRNVNEVYIPIPAWIHTAYRDFFPSRETSFDLVLPNSTIMPAKVCQQGDKALMSNPNDLLGRWILRDILRMPEGELVSYDKLADIGIDSVIVTKLREGRYVIDFRPLGSYERFREIHADNDE